MDREIADKLVAQRMPEVKYHLEHCRVCGGDMKRCGISHALERMGEQLPWTI